jgi:hypothetical protein
MGLLPSRRLLLMVPWRAALLLAAVLILFLQPIASAQEMGFTLEGKVTEQSTGKLTVSTEQNIIFHVTYDDKTEIKRDDGAQASAQDLRVGAQIKVDGELAESGEIKARKIEVEKGRKAAASLQSLPGTRRRDAVKAFGHPIEYYESQ